MDLQTQEETPTNDSVSVICAEEPPTQEILPPLSLPTIASDDAVEGNADAIREKYAGWGAAPSAEDSLQVPDANSAESESHSITAPTEDGDAEGNKKRRCRKRTSTPDGTAEEGMKKKNKKKRSRKEEGGKGVEKKQQSRKVNGSGAKAEEREFRTVYRHTQKLLRREAGSINIQELLVRAKENNNNTNTGGVLMGSPIASIGFPSFSSTQSAAAASGSSATTPAAAAMSALSTLKKHVSELHSPHGTSASPHTTVSAMGLTDKFLSNVNAQKRNTFQRLLQRDKAMSESYANAAQNSSLLSNGILQDALEDKSDSSGSYSSGSDTESLSDAEQFSSESSQTAQRPASTLVLGGGDSQVALGDREAKTSSKRSGHHPRPRPVSLLSSGVELVIDAHPSQSQHSLGESNGWSQHNELYPSFGSPTTASLGSQSKRLLTLQNEHVSRGGEERDGEKANPFLKENSLVANVNNNSLSSSTVPYDGSSQPVGGSKSQNAAEEKEREDEKEKAIISNLVRRHEMWKLRKTQTAASPTHTSNASGFPSSSSSGSSEGLDAHSSTTLSRSIESGSIKITQATPNVGTVNGSAKLNECVESSSATSIHANTTVFRSLLSSPSVKRSSSFFNLSQDEVGYLRRVNSFESTSARNVVIFSGQSKTTTTTTTTAAASSSTTTAATMASSNSKSSSSKRT